MNKVWFVTGASSGIGTGVVRAALEAGDRVVATARNVEKLRAVIRQPASDRLGRFGIEAHKDLSSSTDGSV